MDSTVNKAYKHNDSNCRKQGNNRFKDVEKHHIELNNKTLLRRISVKNNSTENSQYKKRDRRIKKDLEKSILVRSLMETHTPGKLCRILRK